MRAEDEPVKGFLVSCDKNKEKMAIKDAYNFLTEYIEQIYSDVTEEHIRKRIKEDGKEVTLETEVAYSKQKGNRLLTQLQTHVNCLCFIKINPIYKQIDPVRVVAKVMEDVYDRKQLITRYCHRILPVERAFRAEHFRMLDNVDDLFCIRSQGQQIKSWMLHFKCRNNSKFNYKEILKQTEKIAKKYNHFTDIYYPQWTLSIQIANHLMCVSIVERFKETNQFKLHRKSEPMPWEEKEQEKRQPRDRSQKKQHDNDRNRSKRRDGKKREEGEGQQQQRGDEKPEGSKLMQQKIEVQEDDVQMF